MDKEEVLRDCYNYGDTVAFFFVFYETLRNAGLTVEVERDFHGPKGIKRNPDFAVLEARRTSSLSIDQAAARVPVGKMSDTIESKSLKDVGLALWRGTIWTLSEKT